MPTMVTIFKSEEDAKKILSQMREEIHNYGYVTLSDYYDLIELRGLYSYEACKIGWVNLNDAKVQKGKGTGWEIALPEYNWNEG